MTENTTKQQGENLVRNHGQHKLVLYNDNVNFYDYVVETLIEVCGHTELQAEQCTFIAHFKGKSIVKVGQFDELMQMMKMLQAKGLQAQVEKIEG